MSSSSKKITGLILFIIFSLIITSAYTQAGFFDFLTKPLTVTNPDSICDGCCGISGQSYTIQDKPCSSYNAGSIIDLDGENICVEGLYSLNGRCRIYFKPGSCNFGCCSDSDGNDVLISGFIEGYVDGKYFKKLDYCVPNYDNRVWEYTCSDSEIRKNAIICFNGKICSGGKCIAEGPKDSCLDSDKSNLFTKGSISGYFGGVAYKDYDYCDSKRVVEKWCSYSQKRETTYDCPDRHICLDGLCKKVQVSLLCETLDLEGLDWDICGDVYEGAISCPNIENYEWYDNSGFYDLRRCETLGAMCYSGYCAEKPMTCLELGGTVCTIDRRCYLNGHIIQEVKGSDTDLCCLHGGICRRETEPNLFCKTVSELSNYDRTKCGAKCGYTGPTDNCPEDINYIWICPGSDFATRTSGFYDMQKCPETTTCFENKCQTPKTCSKHAGEICKENEICETTYGTQIGLVKTSDTVRCCIKGVCDSEVYLSCLDKCEEIPIGFFSPLGSIKQQICRWKCLMIKYKIYIITGIVLLVMLVILIIYLIIRPKKKR